MEDKTILEKIANIQDKIGTLVKDTKAYNYKYVDLNQILEKLQPLLREEGLVLTQPIIENKVTTIIRGEGQQIESALALPDNLDPQKLGSAITYFRRYTLVSLLALTAEDDDGASASAGVSTKAFAQIKEDYETKGIAPQIEKWEVMSYEQKKIINEIKKNNRK